MYIPKRYEEAKYEDIPKSIQEKVEKIRESRRGIYIHGPCGTGKTHIAYAILKKIDGEKFKISLFNTPELLRYIKRDFDEENKARSFENTNFMGIVDYLGILIIDDLGTEKLTDWVEETIYAIINKRYEEMRPTIFTSNFSLPELSERLGDRIVSRIAGSCDVVTLEGEDKRLKQNNG